MNRRGLMPHAESAAAASAAALGAWVLAPSIPWAVAAFALGAFAAILATRARRRLTIAAAVVALFGATSAGVTSGRVRMVERRWDVLREDLISRASQRLAATLESTVALARHLADEGAKAGADSQPRAFEHLERLVGRGGTEAGVVVLEDGRPWSWAGRHRLPPAETANELYARITPFYVVLESRRQTGNRVAVGHVLLAADSAVPDRERSVAALFSAATGAALEFYAPGRAPFRTDVFDYCQPSCTPSAANPAPDTLFTVRTAPPSQGALKLELIRHGGRTAAIAVLLCLIALMAGGETRTRYLALALAGALFILTPAGTRLGLGGFFSPATYYLGVFDPLTASAGSLLVSAVLLMALGALLRAGRIRPGPATLAGAAVLVLIPPIAGSLAQGIVAPAGGVGAGLWLGWQVAIAVSLAACAMVAAALLPQVIAPRPWVPWAAAAFGILSALLGVAAWRPDGGWPAWYAWTILPALFLAIQSGPRVRQLAAVAVVTGSAAAILTWGAALDGRLQLARADARRLAGERDPLAIALLERISVDPMPGASPRTAGDLYALWRRSPLSSAGYPAMLAVWDARGQLVADLPLAELNLPPRLLQLLAAGAASQDRAVVEVFPRVPGVHAVLARPFPDGSVLTVGVGPKSALIPVFRVARFVQPVIRAPAPYEMALSPVGPDAGWQPGLAWRREGQTIHGDERLDFAAGVPQHLHVTVEGGEVPSLLVRGALLVVLDLALVLLLGLLGEALMGRTEFVNRARGVLRLRSYRLRIALALAVFFIVPTVGFSSWMAGRLRSDAVRSEDLVILQSLRDAGAALPDERGGATLEPLAAIADRIGAELLLYRRGALEFVSAPVLAELGLFDAYLPPRVYQVLQADETDETIADLAIAGRDARVAFRAGGAVEATVLGMPRLADDGPPMGEGDLAYALLLVTLIGLGAAAGLARLAARSLSEPVGVLRHAAETVGRGGTPRVAESDVPEEFVPVAEAFSRMALDVQSSRAALEAARQRTVAVLRNVATGVMALTGELTIVLANPRAEEILDRRLEPGGAIAAVAGTGWAPVWAWVRSFLASRADVSGEEFTIDGRRIRVRASTLGTESGGCVVALDDVTELAHAVRVLAWGEIARQVAHEIKNPLTPMRLGMQHLMRVRSENRGDFERALEQTSRQILIEIDRLDAVARAFARFGAPPVERDAGPLAPVDLGSVARETAALYSLGGGSGVELVTDGAVRGMARPDELKEVLVNLVENARNAHATRITFAVAEGPRGAVVTVTDNGKGIPAGDLPRIFEPRFSTTSSGTGLGLAICRRLVESWGGEIKVESEAGIGTMITLQLNAPPRDAAPVGGSIG